MNYEIRHHKKGKYKNYVLGADVGGTHTNIAIAGIDNKVNLIASFHFLSIELISIIPALQEVMKYAKDNQIKIQKACIGAAGKVENNKCDLTNLNFDIDGTEIQKKFKFKTIILNDLQITGYGINTLTKNDTETIQEGPEGNTRIILAAGTGFGKTICIKYRYFKPYPSEGGHADFPDAGFKELTEFIRKSNNIRQVSYEDVLSSRGLELINEFATKKQIEAHKRNKTLTFKIYAAIYERAVKNLSLDTMA